MDNYDVIVLYELRSAILILILPSWKLHLVITLLFRFAEVIWIRLADSELGQALWRKCQKSASLCGSLSEGERRYNIFIQMGKSSVAKRLLPGGFWTIRDAIFWPCSLNLLMERVIAVNLLVTSCTNRQWHADNYWQYQHSILSDFNAFCPQAEQGGLLPRFSCSSNSPGCQHRINTNLTLAELNAPHDTAKLVSASWVPSSVMDYGRHTKRGWAERHALILPSFSRILALC